MENKLRDWIDAKVKEMNRRGRLFKTSRSALIADAVQNMKDAEEQRKATTKPVGVPTQPASEISVSGPSTATKKNSLRVG